MAGNAGCSVAGLRSYTGGDVTANALVLPRAELGTCTCFGQNQERNWNALSR